MLYWSQSEDKNDTETLERITRCIGEWKKYINPSKWEDWEKFVYQTFDDYAWEGWPLAEQVADVLKNIEEWKNWKVINAMLDPYSLHSGASYSYVRNAIIYFSKKWDEAKKHIKK